MNDMTGSADFVGSRGEASGRRFAVRCIERLLEASPTGCLTTSLDDLVAATQLSSTSQARLAVARLDPVDHSVTVDVESVDEDVVFQIVWAPVTGVIDLMLDWDLPVIELSIAELACWLEVEAPVARRAIERLADLPGVGVTPAAGVGAIRISLDVSICPLTTATRSAA
ncbi:hypothetical protein [Nocardia sp. NBC_01388]|uniref:hypothetical protein n=1 Tax=Nocardia sp. NBC_01388 TaxID=2903596 RepID=UPI00325482FD